MFESRCSKSWKETKRPVFDRWLVIIKIPLISIFLLASSGCATHSNSSLTDYGPANPKGEEAMISAHFDSLNVDEKSLKDYADDQPMTGHQHGSHGQMQQEGAGQTRHEDHAQSLGEKGAPSEHMEGKMKDQKMQNQKLYTCPMHPEVISDKPGKCPKCGMKLVEKSDSNQ